MKVLLKVLIVEDSPTTRKVIKRELLKLHFCPENLYEVADGRQAIKMALSKKFDLIIMDWNLPNIQGIDAIRSIRAAGDKTPILMVTTESQRASVVEAVQAGIDDYLIKPFSSPAFQSKITEMFEDVPEFEPVELKDAEADFESGRISEMK